MPDATTPTECPECAERIRDEQHARDHAGTHWPPSSEIPTAHHLARYRAAVLRGEPVGPDLAKVAKADETRAAAGRVS